MAQHIDNLMAEYGGGVLTPAGTDSFDSTTYGEAQVKALLILEDGTELSGVVMPDLADSDYFNSAVLDKGDIVWGKMTACTVTAGAAQTVLHKKTTAGA